MDPFVTPAEVAAASNGKISETDQRLPLLIAGACQAVRNYCRWHVTPVVSEPIELDTFGERVLLLPTMKLVSVEAVTVAGTAVTSYQPSKLGMLRFASPLPDEFGSTIVEITHGFTAGEVADLRQVVVQAVLNACASPMGATREQAGAISVQWATTAPGVAGGLSLLGRDREILDAYRLQPC